MTDETITEDIEEEVAEEVTDEQGFEALDPNMQMLIERQGTKLGDDEVAEEPTGEEVVEEEVVEEPGYAFELEDGTKVTLDEAKAGYLRHGDYTRKTQQVSDDRKKTERYNAIINKMESDPTLTRLVIDYMTGAQQTQVAQPQAQQLQVPPGYEKEPAIKLLVDELNATKAELTELRGGVNTMQQTSTEAQKQAEQKALFDASLAEGYEYLKGQVGTPPPPKEYVERIEQYVNEQGLDPQVVGNYIISGDPDYLRAKIDGAFKADIDASRQDKVNSGEKERKKRVAKTQTLRVAGKSQTAAPQSLPKGPDGKLDQRAALLQIQDTIEKGTRG